MSELNGFAVVNMGMPLSAVGLPVKGTCSVKGTKFSLKVPGTSIEFNLPCEPVANCADMEFKITSDGGPVVIKVHYVPELRCFNLSGQLENRDVPFLSCTFYSDDSPLKLLPNLTD